MKPDLKALPMPDMDTDIWIDNIPTKIGTEFYDNLRPFQKLGVE